MVRVFDRWVGHPLSDLGTVSKGRTQVVRLRNGYFRSAGRTHVLGLATAATPGDVLQSCVPGLVTGVKRNKPRNRRATGASVRTWCHNLATVEAYVNKGGIWQRGAVKRVDRAERVVREPATIAGVHAAPRIGTIRHEPTSHPTTANRDRSSRVAACWKCTRTGTGSFENRKTTTPGK